MFVRSFHQRSHATDYALIHLFLLLRSSSDSIAFIPLALIRKRASKLTRCTMEEVEIVGVLISWEKVERTRCDEMEHRRRPMALFMIRLRRCIYLVSTGHRSSDSRGSKQPDFIHAHGFEQLLRTLFQIVSDSCLEGRLLSLGVDSIQNIVRTELWPNLPGGFAV